MVVFNFSFILEIVSYFYGFLMIREWSVRLFKRFKKSIICFFIILKENL